MVNKARRLAPLMACALLCGCAAMSESECRSANWFQIGKRDALMGVRPQLDNYARQCAEIGRASCRERVSTIV